MSVLGSPGVMKVYHGFRKEQRLPVEASYSINSIAIYELALITSVPANISANSNKSDQTLPNPLLAISL